MAYQVSLSNIPTYKGDAYLHFTSSKNPKGHYSYHRYVPNIYFVDESNKVSLQYSIEMGDNAIDSTGLKSIILGGKNASKIENDFCNEIGKFCSFYNVAHLSDYLFITFKVNKITYYAFIDKHRQNNPNHFWIKSIKNDLGLPFVLNSFNALDIACGYENQLVSILDLDQVKNTLEKDINPSISSNWNEIKNQITDSTDALLCFMHIQRNKSK